MGLSGWLIRWLSQLLSSSPIVLRKLFQEVIVQTVRKANPQTMLGHASWSEMDGSIINIRVEEVEHIVVRH